MDESLDFGKWIPRLVGNLIWNRLDLLQCEPLYSGGDGSEVGTVPSSQKPCRPALVQAEPSLRPGTKDLTLKGEEMRPDNLRLRR